MQGRDLSGLLFALVIHPELKALNAELEPFGGFGKAYMDDAYIGAPPREAFAAARRFAARIKKMADLDIQWVKVACWSPKQVQDMSYLRIVYGEMTFRWDLSRMTKVIKAMASMSWELRLETITT